MERLSRSSSHQNSRRGYARTARPPARGLHGGTAGVTRPAQGPAQARDRDGFRQCGALLRRAQRGFRASQPRAIDGDRHRRVGGAAEARAQACRALVAIRAQAGDVSARPARRAGVDRISAEGRGRDHRAVEFPGEFGDEPACRGARRGQPGDGQDQRVHSRRGRIVRGVGAALFRGRGIGLRQRRSRDRQGVRRIAVRSSAVHRRDGDREAHPPCRGGQSHPGHARARRQITGGARALGRHRQGHRAGGDGQDAQRRADLPRARLHAGARREGGRGRRRSHACGLGACIRACSPIPIIPR
jgi:hypothetical protein